MPKNSPLLKGPHPVGWTENWTYDVAHAKEELNHRATYTIISFLTFILKLYLAELVTQGCSWALNLRPVSASSVIRTGWGYHIGFTTAFQSSRLVSFKTKSRYYLNGLLGPLLYVYVFLNPGPHVHFKHAYCHLTITKYFEDGLELLSTRIVGVCMYKCIRSFFIVGCSYWGLYLELLSC